MNNEWRVNFNGSFFEVLPVKDTKEHMLGDECWCNPEVQRSVTPNKYIKHIAIGMDKAQPVIVHHSNDKREVVDVAKFKEK